MVRNYQRKTPQRWTERDLLEILKGLQAKTLGVNQAALRYGVSRSTIYRRYKNYLTSGPNFEHNRCGSPALLSKIEEDIMEKTILSLRKDGVMVGSTDIKRICYEYCKSNEIANSFNPQIRMATNDWYTEFLKRHPALDHGKSENKTSDGKQYLRSIWSSESTDDKNSYQNNEANKNEENSKEKTAKENSEEKTADSVSDRNYDSKQHWRKRMINTVCTTPLKKSRKQTVSSTNSKKVRKGKVNWECSTKVENAKSEEASNPTDDIYNFTDD